MNAAAQMDLWSALARDLGAEQAIDNAREWAERADRTIAYLASTGLEFTADDIRRRCGEPDSPNALGAVFLNAQRQGRISLAGYRRSSKVSRHAARVGIWIGTAWA